MNTQLTNEIVKHIFSNLGILDKKKTSILDDTFLSKNTIEYNIDEEKHQAKIWMPAGISNNVNIKLACTEFKLDISEFAIIVEIENCPIYGCYLDDELNGLIAFSPKKDIWMPADIHIQGLFLAGMESFKDLTINFGLCKETKSLYDNLVSFIDWRDSL